MRTLVFFKEQLTDIFHGNENNCSLKGLVPHTFGERLIIKNKNGHSARGKLYTLGSNYS